MKKIFFAVTALAGLAIFNPASAQKEKQKDKFKKDSETQIIILKKGDKDTKTTVETKDGEVFINGKPLSEYKDSDLVISKGNTWHWDGDHKFNLAPMHGYRDMFDSSHRDKHGFLGVTTEKQDNNLEITDVVEGSAAEKAGLKEGDIITKVGDKVVHSPEELSNAISAFKPKDEVRITYSRDGKTNEVKATLGENSWFRSFSFDGPGANGFKEFHKLKDLPRLKDMKGFGDMEGLRDLQVFGAPDADGIYRFEKNFNRARLGIKIQDTEENNGVKVVDVESGSAAEKAGIKKDDIVTEIAGKKVTNTDEARTLLADSKDKTSYSVKVKRNGSEMSFEVKAQKKLKTTNL